MIQKKLANKNKYTQIQNTRKWEKKMNFTILYDWELFTSLEIIFSC